MNLNYIDWLSIFLYILIVLFIGIFLSRKSINNIGDFFTANRELPWWLSGISMVATTFAADTPLAVAGLVITYGIVGNWFWWGFMLSGLFTTFLFAKLWHRSDVTTDAELIEIRYSGKDAQFLRGFRALYLAIPINCIILGWVTSAMAKIISATTGFEPWLIIILLYIITTIYITISGIRGVIFADFLQFFIAMAGSIIIMFAAINHESVNGIFSLVSQLKENFPEKIVFFPNGINMAALTFCVYFAINWWCSWYPGAEPGGGGYIAQRMFTTKSDKDALKSTLLFNVFHYAVRPWPWIITALCLLFIYPGITNGEEGYANFIASDSIPAGFKGLILVAFFSAFMSTISTQINWGSSYIVNDFYARFIRKKESFDSKEKANTHYVQIARFSTFLIMLISMIASYYIDSISGAWKLLISIGAGTGLVYMLRWYWWRINAYSEISAMLGALIGYLISLKVGLDDNRVIIFTTLFTTCCWYIVTLLTPPEPKEVLINFYNKVKPRGNGWKEITTTSYAPIYPLLVNVLLGWIGIQGFFEVTNCLSVFLLKSINCS